MPNLPTMLTLLTLLNAVCTFPLQVYSVRIQGTQQAIRPVIPQQVRIRLVVLSHMCASFLLLEEELSYVEKMASGLHIHQVVIIKMY